MAELSCNVDNCTHNEDHCCCKGEIFIEGKAAENGSSTCCGSFRKKLEGTTRNSLEHSSHTIEVDCEAGNCAYNNNCSCTAGHIGIAGGSACVSVETECSSFKHK
ncbi:MAG: DUF1540 domain-containing protein [Lachnospiraceae bacterium]